jgi:MoxR-like ATPase
LRRRGRGDLELGNMVPGGILPGKRASCELARRRGAPLSSPVVDPRQVLGAIREELQQIFLERTEVIDGALVALLAGQHVLLIGPPGTAKSMLADEVCRRLTGARYFQWLLTRFTTPEELFGAVSLQALEQDDYRRITTHKLPEAHIAFLDEVFKASSSILNTILTLMNERRFHNGREVVPVPLLSLFAASNELPEDDELRALDDRFLLRFVVDYLSEDFRFLKLLQARPPAGRTTLPLAELEAARAQAAALPVPGEVLRTIADIRRELGRKQLVASDRRYAQSIGVLRAHAYLEGREAVSDEDVPFLEHVLWRDPAEREQVRAAIRELLRGWEDEVRILLYQSRELRDYALRTWETAELRTRAAVEAHTKIRNILGKVDAILSQARSGGRPVEQVELLRREIAQIQQEMLARL